MSSEQPQREQPQPDNAIAPDLRLYHYISHYAQTHPPDAVLQHLRHLFVETKIEQSEAIYPILGAIVLDKSAAETFPQILLRICYRLVDVWQLNVKTRHRIPELATLFEASPKAGLRQARVIRRLRELVALFGDCEASRSLQRLCQLYRKVRRGSDQHLESLLPRYTNFYGLLVLPAQSEYELNQTIRYCQERRQQNYGMRLARFVTYQARLAQTAKALQLSDSAGRLVQHQREPNPTFLSDRDFLSALHYFLRRSQGPANQTLLAERLRREIPHLDSYAQFKEHLYAYLVTDSEQDDLNTLLQEQLRQILPNYESRNPSEGLSLRTATKLLNFLVMETNQQLEHYPLIETIAEVGAIAVVDMLWKLILLCPPLAAEVDKRFARLFDHYAHSLQSDVQWLVQLLEVHHLASTVYQGHTDLSLLNVKLKPKQNPPTE